ncbi:alpha-amylase [Chloroflexota bacterium]|nr:alpha-amylase [Chloroflexota bacterium]
MNDDFVFGNTATQNATPGAQVTSNGIIHRSARMPLAPKPGEPVQLTLKVNADQHYDAAWVYYTTDGSDPSGQTGKPAQGTALTMLSENTAWNPETKHQERLFQVVIPGQEAGTVVRYRISTYSEKHGEVFADNGLMYGYLTSDHTPPSWTQEAIIYHIFIDRFASVDGFAIDPDGPLDGFMGGSLKGITNQLDYLVALGVNVLYLSPIFTSPSYHGYDAVNYYEIENRLGSLKEFKELLDQAHARNLRVILDFVPNHCSDHHPSFQSAISDSYSPYRDWFTFNTYPNDFKTFFGVRSMPCFNLRNKDTRDYILNAILYWLDFGVDGYRLDYAIGPSPDFWAELSQVVQNRHPDAWVFGEVVDSLDVQLSFNGLLDGVLDFKLMEALRQTFAYCNWKANDFTTFLTHHQAFFPDPFSRPSFLDNHDMDRFLWAAGGEKRKLKLAALCQFTLSGAPIIYYGTEIGLSQRKSVTQEDTRFGVLEEARLPMPDAKDIDLLEFYTGLIQFRKANLACISGTWTLLENNPEIIAYRCINENQKIVVALNITPREQTLVLANNWNKQVFTTSPGTALIQHAETTEIHLPPLTGAVLS